MGEVAALSAAFESETNKALAALPAIAACPPSEHDQHLIHHRMGQRITELILYYSSRLPPYVCINRILSIGDRLTKANEFRLARDACYTHVQAMQLHQQPHVARMDSNARLSSHVQACYGVSACEAALVLAADPHLKHPSTLQTLVHCLHQFKDALTMVLPVEALYWLTLNGTVHIYTLSKHLLTAGFVAQMLPFLLFCVKSLDQHVTFSTARYLPWWTQLYSALCYAYSDAKSYEPAKRVVQDGLSRIDSLIKLQKLDPVPAPPEIQVAYKTAKAMLCSLKLKLEVQSAPSDVQPPVPAATDKKAAAAAAAAPDTGMVALQPLLAELALTPKFKLTVMLEALQLPGRRIVRHAPVYGLVKDLFEATKNEAMPMISKLREIMTAATAPVSLEADLTGTPAQEAQALTSPCVPAPLPGGGVSCNPAEAEEFSILLHRTLLCTAYNLEQAELFQDLCALAEQRLAVGAVGAADDTQVAVFSAVVQLLGAVNTLEKSPGAESLRQVSSTLASICSVGKAHVPDMLTDAALALHQQAKPLLDGVFCARDKEAGLVADILRTLHMCWEAVDLDDCLLRPSHAIKLALLLEEMAVPQGEGGPDDSLLYEARDVLTAARTAVTRFRCELNLVTRGAADEGVRWITASRNQPSDASAALVETMPDTDAELACLHTDLLAAFFRVEMAIGVAEQKSSAQMKQTRLAESVRRREAQSNIFGVRTMKEKRIDEVRIQEAAATPAHPPAKEREILSACGKNGYEKSIALMQMAVYQSEQHRQVALLTEAADLLVKAQEREDQQFAAAQPDRGKTAVPLQPKILQRTPTSCTLTSFPFNLKGGKRVARFAVYAKSFGAGVALILNKTASEYPGTGTQVAPGTRVNVEGLRSNDTYVFGIAAYDENGALISELGTSSVEMLAGLPLPLYHCWAHLLLTACKLKLWPLAKRAASVLFPHFIVTRPDRPLWEANPLSAQTLNEKHLATASRTLLRGFAQGVYAYTGATLQAELAILDATATGATSRGTGPPLAEIRAPYLSQQVARLKSIKRLMMAMHVAVVLEDEMLIQEGAVRCYHMLGPLLTVKNKSPFIHRCLSHVYRNLQAVTNLIQDSQVGQELQRYAAARVICATSYHSVLMAAKAGEDQAASLLAALQLDVLKAYDPVYSIPGRPPTKETLPDLQALLDGIMAHPGAKQWAANTPNSLLAQRLADPSDLAAQVLPIIAGPNPIDAWLQHLSKEDNVEHPRWVELTTRMIEACVRAGLTEMVAAVAEQVRWSVRAALARPPIDFPRWKLDDAVAALTTVTLAPEDEPAKPQLEGLSEEEKAAAQAQWQQARDAALLKAKQREAAVVLLQRRLPVLLARMRVVDKCRASEARWAPWRARLAAVLGLHELAQGRAEVQARVQAQILDLSDGVPAAGVAGSGGGGTPTRPRSPAQAASPTKTGKPGSAGKASKAAPAPPPPSGDDNDSAALKSLQQLARAAQLAAKCQAWHELLNATRHVWNAARALLNVDAGLLVPTPALVWEQQPMPTPPTPPASILLPGAGGKDAKGKAAAPAKKDDKAKGKPPSAKGGKKGAAPDPNAPPERVWPPVPLPTNARLNVGRVLRAAVEPVLDLVEALKNGSQLCTGVLPLSASDEAQQSIVARSADTASAQAGGRPSTQQSAAYASSNFSYGSDLQVELWFAAKTLDMQRVHKFVMTVLTALHRMQRHHAVMALGTRWMKLSEGHFNESLLPVLLASGPSAGVDIAPLQSTMEVVMRDKNAALDALDKVRRMIREKLGDITPLNQPISTRVKKKRRAQLQGGRPGTGQSLGSNMTGNDTASMVSSYTYQTQSSLKGSNQQPDFIRLPQEYEKVIEVLKSRGEKGAMILAINEMGDVHAHFGNWGGAINTWHDALDTLLGPYQVLKGWRKVLDPMTDQAILQQYGVHGCLLAGGILLGKLTRYAYFQNMGMRLEACRMAAVMLRALFCADAVHPQRMVGFATYVPVELWQGVNVFSDPYRCNMTDLLSGLETITCCLVDNGLALEALPVAALWEHVAYLVTRNLPATVLCRVVRVHALVQLGLLKEAAGLLVELMQGQRLPDLNLESDMVIKDEQGKPLQAALVPPLNAAAYPGDPSNQPSVGLISEGPLNAAIEKLHGPWLVARLALARAAFLQALGQVPNHWSATQPSTGHKATTGGPPPVETGLLERAAVLISRAKTMAQGLPLEPETGPRPPSGKGGKGAPPAKKDAAKDKKGAAQDPGSEAPAGPASPLMAAQRSEVMVRALLAESQLELLRARPKQALEAALAALQYMGELSESQKLNMPLGDNDDTERFSLGPGLWLAARMQAVQCNMHLRNVEPSHKLLSKALEEANAVSDARMAAALLHLQANLYHVTGHTAKALETYAEVIARLQALQISDTRLTRALADASLLRDQLGLREDSARLFTAALQVARQWVCSLGLSEAREHKELVNIYMVGILLYSQLLERVAVCSTRQKQVAPAAQLLEEALSLLQHQSRGLPGQQAVTALLLGRGLRLSMQMSDSCNLSSTGSVKSPGATSQAPEEVFERAQSLLTSAFTLAALDGGHLRHVMREALLELATLYIHRSSATQAAVCLRHAYTVGVHLDTLLLANHTLAPINMAQVPESIRDLVRGQEESFVASKGTGAQANVSDTDLSRLIMCHFTALLRALPSLPSAEAQRCMAAITTLHTTLKAACPKYSSDVCLPDVVLPPTAEDAAGQGLAAGTVLVQWAVQDGCPQEPKSWYSGGSLPGLQVSDAQVLALEPVPAYVSMLYVVAAQGGVRMGERVFQLSSLRELQHQVKRLRHRTESPKGPTDIFGEDAPAPYELRFLRRASEYFLSGRRLSDDGAAVDLDTSDALPDSQPEPMPATPPPAAKGKAPAGGKGAAAEPPKPVTPPPTDLAFLIKLETMLNVDTGIELVDASFAEYLAQALPQ